MKKTFHSYLAVWAICLAIFNLIAFAAPNEFDGGFFVGYIFITLAFLGQLFCAKIVFRQKNLQKLFYKLPLAGISLTGTLVMLLFGGLSMAIPSFPVWLGIILCFAVLGFTAMAVIGANEASEAVGKIDQKIKADTLFIKMLTADAETLMAKASPENKETVKKVWETLRYSDPVSNPALASAEAQITVKFEEFRAAVTGNTENLNTVAEELTILIIDRNKKCKLLKE